MPPKQLLGEPQQLTTDEIPARRAKVKQSILDLGICILPPEETDRRKFSARDFVSSFHRDKLPSEISPDAFVSIDAEQGRRSPSEWTIAGDLEGTLITWATHQETVFELLEMLQSPEQRATAFWEKLPRRLDTEFAQYDDQLLDAEQTAKNLSLLVKEFEQDTRASNELLSSRDNLPGLFMNAHKAFIDALKRVCQRASTEPSVDAPEPVSLYHRLIGNSPAEERFMIGLLEKIGSRSPHILVRFKTELEAILSLLNQLEAPSDYLSDYAAILDMANQTPQSASGTTFTNPEPKDDSDDEPGPSAPPPTSQQAEPPSGKKRPAAQAYEMAAAEVPTHHKAIVYDEPGKISTKIEEIETPKPSFGEVLVRLTHSGVCHSDMGVMMRSWSWLPAPTAKGQIGGHEGVGEIVAFGSGTENSGLKKGQRVGIKWMAAVCGNCAPCLAGADASCVVGKISGYFTPGTFQQYALAPANYVTPIPDGLPSDVAAPMLCGGLTVYSALKKSGAQPGDWVVIPGAGGGLGHLALQIGARGLGFRMIGIDAGEKEQLAKDCGAEAFFDITKYSRDKEGSEKLAADVKAATGRANGAAAVIVCTASNAAYAQALSFLKFGGTLVCVGVPEGVPVPIASADPATLLVSQLKIIGSAVGNRKEAVETLELAERGIVKTHFITKKMDNLTEVFEQMDKGRLQGRSEEQKLQWSQQSDELPKPPLPPRPSSSGALHGPPQSAQWAALPQAYTAQQVPYWQDAYSNQSQTTASGIPPPPPPRPPEYQAQLQAQYQAESFPHPSYSHQPPSHHYDPRAQTPQRLVYPSQQHDFPLTSPTPSSHMAYDPTPVSPIEPDPRPGPQPPATAGPSNGNTSLPSKPENQFYASVLGTGNPSDWEHFGDGHPTAPQLSPEPSKTANATHAALPSPPPMPAAAVPSSPTHYETPAHHLSNESYDHAPRRDSHTTSVLKQGINRTGTIDSVIQAWNQPLNVSAKLSQQGEKQGNAEQQPDNLPPSRGHEVEKIVEKVVDPYSDLEPEFRASLKRYVLMLRKEAAADTDEAKFELFESFIRKELRLRSLLYGIEPHLQDLHSVKKWDVPPSPANLTVAQQPTRAKNAPVQPEIASEGHSPESQTRDPLPSQKSVIPALTRSDAPAVGSQVEPSPKVTDGHSQDLSSTAAQKAVRVAASTLAPLKTTSSAPPEGVDATDIDAEYSPGGRPLFNRQQDDTQFSPGGRPIVARPKVTTKISERSQQMSESKQSLTKASPSANAPMVLDDYLMAQPPSPSANAPMVIESDLGTEPQEDTPPTRLETVGSSPHGANMTKAGNTVPAIKFEPSRPAYEPFKYNSDIQPPTQPADQSYSSLRKDATDSSRLLVREPAGNPESSPNSRTSTADTLRAQDGGFIGLIRAHSKAVRPKKTAAANLATISQLRPGTPNAAKATDQAPASRETQLGSANSALRSLLPTSVPEQYELSRHPKARALKAKIGSFSDDFRFIRETVIAWDRKNREVRQKLDEERNARQAESETQIDGLFNDNEIGYADIGHLEAEFKLQEAEKRYKEDQAELESFTKGVYEPVTERINKELFELDTHYNVAVELLDSEAAAASQYLRDDRGKAEMGFVMNCTLSAFQKLETRHQKLAEADVERERRRKRLELTVLYTNGDTQGVKKVEQEFAVAEKMQVLHEARAGDTRANALMDAFDRATVRGLGDNQTYIDDLLVRIRQVKDMVLKEPSNIAQEVYAPDGPRDSLWLAQTTLNFVLTDSQKLLALSNVADKLLNDSDYFVSVAEARVSNADQITYQRLAEEKENEDAKIVNDMNSRLSSIGKTPEAAIALIREVVDKVGDDPEHQERIKKALEAAKQRNTGIESGSACYPCSLVASSITPVQLTASATPSCLDVLRESACHMCSALSGTCYTTVPLTKTALFPTLAHASSLHREGATLMADPGLTAAVSAATSTQSLPEPSVDELERPGKRQKLNPPLMIAAAAAAESAQAKAKKSPPPSQTSARPASQSTGALMGTPQNEMNKADNPAASSTDPATTLSGPMATVSESLHEGSDEVAGDGQAHTSPVSLSSIGTLESVAGPTVMTTTVGSPLPMEETVPQASVNADKGLSTPENDTKAMSYPAPFLTPQVNNDARRGMSLPHSATRQEKPYVCSTCQSRFRRLHDLKRHTKLHTGERPHVCPKCRRKFARGDALARHNKGPGGCAGRRASMSSFGGADGGFEGSEDMDGVVYGEPESFDEEEGNDKRPGIRRQPPSGDDSQDSTGQASRIPSTYPPIQGRPPGGIATGHFPPRGGFGPPLGPASPGAGTLSNSLGYPSHTGSTSSRYLTGSYAQNPITESPRPLSPGQSRGTSGALDHRNRSPTITSYPQAPGSSFGRSTASSSSMMLSGTATQLPPPPGFLPSQTGPTHPPTQPTGPPTRVGSGPLSSNSNSLSSHGQSGHGSVETSSPMFAKDDRIWAYVKSLEQRMNGMQEEINGLRAQLVVAHGQRLA
ncbi:hypothetical protein DV736_g100, partial [Chaetothyriales sp. CBS 134916]